jgi:hypothetical protein
MDVAVTSPTPPEASVPRSGAMSVDLSRLGNNLVSKFHVMMRVSQIYDAKNVTFRQFMQESLETINTLVQKEGGLSLKIVRDDIFFNDQRLRYSVEGFTSFKYLMTLWKKKLIGGVTFRGPIDEGALQAFIYTMNNLPEGREENAAQRGDGAPTCSIH